ncbi:MAG: HPr family phosphocarrier protein [Mariprofundus sp.]
MFERRIKICNKLGLHARASARLASAASQFSAEINLVRGDLRINCKSIMGIMMLAAARGSELLLEAEGNDAIAALDALESLVNDRFGEAE